MRNKKRLQVMESSGSVKLLRARQKWRKRSSVVMILKGDRERMRSLQRLIDGLDVDSTTTSRSYISAGSSSNSHVVGIGSDIAETFSDEARLTTKMDNISKGLMIICLQLLTVDILQTTFPWMRTTSDDDPSAPLSQSEFLSEKLVELVWLLISYWIVLPYIYAQLVKDKRNKPRRPFRDDGWLWLVLFLIHGTCLCICSTVNFANFHQHENDQNRNRNSFIRGIFCLCLVDCRQLVAGGYKLKLPYMIKEAFTPEWFPLLCNIVFAVSPSLLYRPILRSDPGYAEAVTYCASVNVLCSIMGLVLKGQQERVKSRRWGKVWWFYHPDPDSRPFGTLPDIYGLISAIYQLIVATVYYVCLLMHIDNPIQLCLLPTIFLVCLACSTSHRSHGTKGISVEWVFLLINIGLEISSAAFEQLSSSSKPHYALYAMLLAITAVIISILELVHKGKKENVKLMKRKTLWWFYHRDPPYTPFGSLLDIYGLIGGIAQCIFSIVQYVCYLWHVDNPTQQLCLLPTIFYICVALSKVTGKSKIH